MTSASMPSSTSCSALAAAVAPNPAATSAARVGSASATTSDTPSSPLSVSAWRVPILPTPTTPIRSGAATAMADLQYGLEASASLPPALGVLAVRRRGTQGGRGIETRPTGKARSYTASAPDRSYAARRRGQKLGKRATAQSCPEDSGGRI